MRDNITRFGTLFMAGLFLVTTLAFSAVLFWQANQEDDNTSLTAETQEQLNQQLEQANQQSASCDIRTPEQAPAETEPGAFKPEGDVTALNTTDLTVGTGREAKAGDCLVMKYVGTLATNGEKFDGNFDESTALQFTLGSGTVIEGWDQGLAGMKEGGLRRVVIPSELGYGENGSGETIPPNSDLVFTVKLVRIKDLQ